MSLIVTISDVETNVKSIQIRNMVHSQPDSCTFIMEDTAAPAIGAIVKVYYDQIAAANILFGGSIVRRFISYIAPSVKAYHVTCLDFQHILDRRLVAKAYENQTARQIVEDILTDFVDASLGFTAAFSGTGTMIDRIVFNYVSVTECIKELARISQYSWYVDYDRVLQFFQKESSSAPFAVNDENVYSKIIWNLILDADYKQVRNRVYVRGGIEYSDTFSDEQAADGSQRAFRLAYKPIDFALWVAGVPQVVGTEFVNTDDGTYDYIVNPMEKVVRCSEFAGKTATPAAGVLLLSTYKYETPILVRIDDPVSQANIAAIEGGDGIYEYMITDLSIQSSDQANYRALSELANSGSYQVTGSFNTYAHGIRAGQALTIDLDGHELNGTYLVEAVTITCSGNLIKYEVRITSLVG